MKHFSDVSALQGVLRVLHEKVPRDARHDALAQWLIDSLGFTSEQASLYTSTVLSQNGEDSADLVALNAENIFGSWARGEQEGMVGGWLSTMKETWLFNHDLTYEHKIERHENYISTGPYIQSSYSRPSTDVERGIWAPPDWRSDKLSLFKMSLGGSARRMTIELIANSNHEYQACFIGRERFVRE